MSSATLLTPQQKLEAFRAVMREHSTDAYIIGNSDPHQSEYVADYYKTRSWISGFSGSAGTVVVTKDAAGLWTDSRYYLEAEHVLKNSGIQLFRQGMPDVPSPAQWLADTLPERSVVRYDAACMSVTGHNELADVLEAAGILVQPGIDLPGLVWTDRPAMPEQPVVLHEGPWQSSHDKIERLTQWMAAKRIDYLLVSALDDIAWLLNLRGSDVEYNPVFYAYLLVGAHGHTLFLDNSRVPKPVYDSLNEQGVAFARYDSLGAFLETLSSEDRILLPPVTTATAWRDRCAHMKTVSQGSPVAGWKAVKSPEELDALRATQIRDGVAMVKTLFWVESTAAAINASGNGADVKPAAAAKEKNVAKDAGLKDKNPKSKNGSAGPGIDPKTFTEFAIGQKSSSIRAAGKNYVGPSFTPIAGFASNGAIVHYSPDPKNSKVVKGRGLLLLDTGGQYLDGTTDVTRVLALGGSPTKAEKEAYTLVLKGHIALGAARFPRGTGGHQLDVLARKALWEKAMNFGHGTGHGIGFYLNVHEGPQRISPGAAPVALEPGMLVSNEPGYYETGSFGIRIENMVAVAEDPENPAFLRFETLTFLPYESDLIETSLLSIEELAWLNAYHEQVREKLAKELKGEELKWLKEKTKTLYVLRS